MVGLSQREKDISRQIQLYAKLVLMFLMVIGSMYLTYLDKDITGLGVIIATGFASIAGSMGMNYFTKPVGA